MKPVLVALAALLVACDDRRPQDDPEDADVPKCSLTGTPTDPPEAQAEVEALLTCEGGLAGWEVTCSPAVEQWHYPQQPAPDGDDIVGYQVIICQAASEQVTSRTFEFEVGELRLPPVQRGVGPPRCVVEGTPSGDRYSQCRSPATNDAAEPAYPEVTTLEAAYGYVGDLLSCAGCPEEEYQVDCWGPAELLLDRPDVRGWRLFACRVSDLVRPGQMQMLIPFETF